MHKLFSVSWAKTPIMLACAGLIDYYSPWFVVAKGAEKCLQFFISCHSICSSRDGVETFLQIESVVKIHLRIAFDRKEYLLFVQDGNIHSRIIKQN